MLAAQLAIGLHIAIWLRTGRAVTPVEPSEAMQFAKSSIINAGLIFLGLAILSTLILGRWFCGWGCHILALQDGAGWLLRRLKIRPRPLRSPLLLTVPLSAAIYMFITPVLLRALPGGGAGTTPLTGPVSFRLTTTDFWATFPPWLPALLTFITCGGLAVYFLGAKGFCTYGCPYGAIFAAADRLAPLRIRVTDACAGCGECTAVCTSNVRVHQEVRDFGMVVDPGCMKCLDCVSACPSDALYVGWPSRDARSKSGGLQKSEREAQVEDSPGRAGASAAGPRHARKLARAGAAPRASSQHQNQTAFPLLGILVAVAFIAASLALFIGHDVGYRFSRQEGLAWLATLVLTVLAWLALGGARQLKSVEMGREAALGVFFLFAIFALRGAYGMVAFLFALGAATVLSFLVVTAARAMWSKNLTLHNFQLKLRGRLTRAGGAFLALSALLVAGLGFLTNVQVAQARTQMLARRIAELESVATQSHGPRENAELAALYREMIARRPRLPDPYLKLGLMLTRAGQFDQARAVYKQALAETSARAQVLTNLGIVEAVQGRLDLAMKSFEQAIAADATLSQPHAALAQALAQADREREAVAEYERAVQLDPRDFDSLLELARLRTRQGDLAGARQAIQAAGVVRPDDSQLRELAARLGLD